MILCAKRLITAMALLATPALASAQPAPSPLGDPYVQGMVAGVSGDFRTAAANFRVSCDAGLPAACYQLGLLIDSDRLGKRDPIAAARVQVKACAAKSSHACRLLGVTPDSLRGVNVREQRTDILLGRGHCESGGPGYALSCANAGVFEVFGSSEVQDPSRGRLHLQLACDGGSGAGVSTWR